MNKNIKVAKQLVKLAKNLIALDEEGDGSGFQLLHDYEKLTNITAKIADKEGDYENFSGIIRWGHISGTVKNATFSIYIDGSQESIWWYDGTWKNGTFSDGIWDKGIWENGTFQHSYWKNGLWKNGTFQDSTWDEGIWNNGYCQNGTWYDGTWKNGTWKSGFGLGSGGWYGGIWKDGVWKDGRWYDGVWGKGRDKNHNKHGKGDSPDKW